MKLKDYIKTNSAFLGVWLVLFLTIWIQSVAQTESLLESILFSTMVLVCAYPFSKYLSETLLQRAMKRKNIRLFAIQFLCSSILIGFFFVGLIFFFAFLEQKGIFPYSTYFDIDIPISILLVPISAGVAINLCICGIRFFEENMKLKRTLTEYQLRTLQHQITPHFMFNVLNHINILMQTDVVLASNLLIKYSETLRYQLYYGDKQEVTLEQDIQFLKDFIAIEEIRWEGKIVISSSWNLEDPKMKIPALLFIAFIENSFKHVSKSDFEKGYININFKQKKNILELDVENAKSTLNIGKKTSSGLGLKNIKERLDILFFGKYDLNIEQNNSFYKIKLTINT